MNSNNNNQTKKTNKKFHVDINLHTCTRYHYAHNLTKSVCQASGVTDANKCIKVYLCDCRRLVRKDGKIRTAKNLKKKALYMYRGQPFTYNSVMGITKNKKATERVTDFLAFRNVALKKHFSFDDYTHDVSQEDVFEVPLPPTRRTSKRKASSMVQDAEGQEESPRKSLWPSNKKSFGDTHFDHGMAPQDDLSSWRTQEELLDISSELGPLAFEKENASCEEDFLLDLCKISTNEKDDLLEMLELETLSYLNEMEGFDL